MPNALLFPAPMALLPMLKRLSKKPRKLGIRSSSRRLQAEAEKALRIAHNDEEFAKLFVAARAEAEASFGNPDVYLEKMIMNPRHIEVQVMGDKYGNYVHLGERDCTTQRRRQKLIEEAPSPALTPKQREKIGQAAVAVVKEAGYHSVGTVEFLLDDDHQFYFMEVNTRIQVEHTVTEEFTGIDLVKEQIRIAMGKNFLSNRTISIFMAMSCSFASTPKIRNGILLLLPADWNIICLLEAPTCV